MLTDLSLFLTSTNSGTASRQLVSAAPASETSVSSKTGQANGIGELYSRGNTGAWAAAANLPDPTGNGFIWDVTTLEGQRFPVGLWRPVVRLITSAGTVEADLYVRLFKVDAAGTYTPIATATATGITLTGGVAQVVTPTPSEGAQVDFGVGEKLYVDVFLDITSNASGDAAATTSLYENGGLNESILSPGYDATPSAAVKTALDMITAAMRKLGLVAQGETISASDSDIGLEALNGMIDRWNAERLCQWALKREVHNLTASKGTYTIGPGAADFDGQRPIRIETANILYAGLIFPQRLYSQQEFALKRELSSDAVMPEGLYCDYGWPIATLRFESLPKCTSPTQLELYVWTGIPIFTALTDVASFPPGYYEAMVANLAIRLAPEFPGAEVSQSLLQVAADGKIAISTFNAAQIPGAMEQINASAQQAQQAQQK